MGTDATTPDADGWGIQTGYHDVFGRWASTTPAIQAALRAAMGATDPAAPAPPPSTPLRVVRHGEPATTEVTERAHLVLEDGTVEPIHRGRLPADLPLGIHRVEAATGRSAPHVEHLVVSPPRAHLPEGLRAWGITAQLYAARSRRSWGIGDLRDLGTLRSWADERGARTIGLNPLHAHAPGGPPANSPYSPASRRWLDPISLDVEAVVGDGPTPEGWDALVAAGRHLAGTDRIDRAAAWDAKLAALEALWPDRRGDAAFAVWRAERGGSVELWGTWCALAERHGPSWRSWPTELQRPRTPAVAQAVADPASADRVAFWAWLQFLTERQLAVAGGGRVVTDLAVGFSADGFDAWDWQDLLADGVRIGAPPDLLGPDGQDWGLPPFVPWKVRRIAYAPILETLRANLRHGCGIRIDHVMGLLRLFWIPPGAGATDGAYVRWHGSELVDLVVLESVRAGALVIGEDLGTVEPGVRELLRDRGLLSTRLLWFEDDPPTAWPPQAMAAVTTHDLPTIAGVWSGTDLADQRAAGVTVATDGDAEMRHHLRVAGSCDDAADEEHVAVAAHRAIAASPCALATASLDDLTGAVHRPNVPGTVDEHPNWRIPLPVPIDDLLGLPRAEAIAAALAEARPAAPR